MTLSTQLKSAALYTGLDSVKELLERAAAAVPCWQPILTAPRDGTQVILGYAPDDEHEDGYVAPGRWHEEDFDGPDNMGHDAGFMDDQYQFFRWARSFGNPKYVSAGIQPTHWMPLPPPPLASQGEQL